ncbi:hypothetical protein BGX31_001110 [Mortierella sp. GBA43]|nr:hypothetical protein BGX31_001110 [Mortierella sp. GBA43]
MIKSTALLVVVVATLSGVLGYNDNCNGSSRCNKNMGNTCRGAIARYTDGTTYNAYTSRTNGNCVAIYRCTGDYPSLKGSEIKDLFKPIYEGQGCKGCGSHAFNGGKCEVTVNFCHNCLDSGNPHQ